MIIKETKFTGFYEVQSPLSPSPSGWRIEDILKVVTLIKEYAEKKGLQCVTIYKVEDNQITDPANQRFDVTIQYPHGDVNRCVISQKLVILRGEVLDGKEFHKRYNEFYGESKEATL